MAVFQDSHTQPETLAREVMVLSEYNEQAVKRSVVLGEGPRKLMKNVRWTIPRQGQVALNCDGALKRDPLRAGAGCILRDHEGKWLGGCVRNIGICTSLQAELWALADGMELAWELGHRDVLVQVDCLVALTMVKNSDGLANANMSLIRRIHHLLSLDWRINVVHVFREGNRCADLLASCALSLEVGLHTLEDPPDGLIVALQEDVDGVACARLCICTD